MQQRELNDRSLIAFVAGITNINLDSVHNSLAIPSMLRLASSSCSITSVKVVVGRAKRASHWGVQSRFRVIYICWYVCRMPKCVGGIT